MQYDYEEYVNIALYLFCIVLHSHIHHYTKKKKTVKLRDKLIYLMLLNNFSQLFDSASINCSIEKGRAIFSLDYQCPLGK